MKKLIVVFFLTLISAVLLAQNGTYRCNSQRFEDENDPTKNRDHIESMIITIDINDITGGYILVSWPSENATYKWDIIKKLDTSVNTEIKTVFTYYEARFNLANVQANYRVVAIIIQDMKDNSLNIAFHNPAGVTTNWYNNLIKITY